jgi:hypothetical protein
VNDFHTVMGSAVGVCLLLALGGRLPGLGWLGPALLVALALAGWATWAVRRELRIRRRLVTPDPRPATTGARS